MQYRRANIKGGTYFFTVNLADRKENLLIEHINDLRAVMQNVKQQHPFHIDAMVVLPDHLHAVWTLPKDDADYPKRWMLIKSGLSRCIPNIEHRRKSRINKGERGIWQRRYWEHLIRNEQDYEQHVNYIHYNPVKHGYVNKPVDWKYSSIHRFIRNGVIDRNWGIADSFNGDNYGERI
jgi:putative transposase